MMMILKTFKLSKSLVHLLYVLLIIIAVSYQTKGEQANPSQADDKNNNSNGNIQSDINRIPSNVDNPTEGSVNNDGKPSSKMEMLQGVFSRMNLNRNKPSQTKPSGPDTIDDQQPEPDDENQITDIQLGLSSEPEIAGDTNQEEAGDENMDKKKRNKKKKKKKSKEKKDKEKLEIDDDKAKSIEMNTNGDETDIRESNNIKDQQPDDENQITDIQLGLSSEPTSTERNAELDKEKTKINKQKKETDIEAESSDPEKNSSDNIKEDTPQDLTLSSLENVGIVKIKKNQNATSEAIRKEKKKKKFKEFTPSGGNARIYCTFLGDVLKMYNKIKKRFVGHFCHAIVFGTPIILKQNQVHLSNNTKNHLKKIDSHKQESLLIVIMKCSSYNDWKKALANSANIKQLVANIMKTVKIYKIDGIQFSNLQPITGEDPVDTHTVNNLIIFFQRLQKAARKKYYDLKIGITIPMNSQWLTSSFTSFGKLNELVTWYSYQTISMVTCSPEYKSTGTSPLEGEVSLMNSLNNLKEIDIDMSKLVVGIQLFPNKVNQLDPFTYEELCSVSKDSWDEWCAAHPENLRLKGLFLRNNEIGGVQLIYMHSDDYRSTCGCYSFPLTRALLRGLINTQTEEQCDFSTAHN